jgi:hypothetical protein
MIRAVEIAPISTFNERVRSILPAVARAQRAETTPAAATMRAAGANAGASSPGGEHPRLEGWRRLSRSLSLSLAGSMGAR